MKRSVNFTDFCDEFVKMGRNDCFSYEGKKALFEYLENLEEDTGIEYEIDVIAFCQEYTEYPTALEAAEDYYLWEPEESEEDKEEAALQFLQERTCGIIFDEGVIIENN